MTHFVWVVMKASLAKKKKNDVIVQIYMLRFCLLGWQFSWKSLVIYIHAAFAKMDYLSSNCLSHLLDGIREQVLMNVNEYN